MRKVGSLEEGRDRGHIYPLLGPQEGIYFQLRGVWYYSERILGERDRALGNKKFPSCSGKRMTKGKGWWSQVTLLSLGQARQDGRCSFR